MPMWPTGPLRGRPRADHESSRLAQRQGAWPGRPEANRPPVQQPLHVRFNSSVTPYDDLIAVMSPHRD
ncbi:hypothetical protein EYF80_065869 [Liparis tanakae]|uniref:Uncharacterized protein n=1 Tax=Liparis tanakae TaxID=230148 RepID=A0A4Z2E5E4_9TELE|nr:hypothetical protein EYF80_065869 [Liparis tanakae]